MRVRALHQMVAQTHFLLGRPEVGVASPRVPVLVLLEASPLVVIFRHWAVAGFVEHFFLVDFRRNDTNPRTGHVVDAVRKAAPSALFRVHGHG